MKNSQVKSGAERQGRLESRPSNKARAKRAPVLVEDAASLDHGHDECGCGHDHGGGCDFELAVRPFKPEDYKELKAVWKAGEIALDETDSARAIKLNLEQRKGSYQIFVAEVIAVDPATGKPAGARNVAGGVVVTFDGHRAYIYHFAVHPDFRGVGLGSALLETCEHQARLWGAKHFRLMSRTDPGRSGARKLYEKHGWKCETGLCQFKKDL